MRSAVGINVAVMLMAVLAGCGGGGTFPNSTTDEPTILPNPSTDAMGMMSPVDALAAIPGRESSALLLWRDGHEYEPGLTQRVESDAPSARFLPQWEDNSGVGNLAYAIYSFNVQGYGGKSELTLDWDEAPQDFGNLWIGLSHWGNNSWKWYAGPANGTLDFGETGFAGYAKPGSGDMLISLVMLGSSPARFSMMGFSDQVQQGWPMFGLNPQGSRGSPHVGAQTDNVKWSYRVPGSNFGFLNPITGPDGTIYGSGGADLHALNPDGTVKWYGESCQPASRPALAGDGTVYVGSWDDKLVAFNPDGSLKWSFNTQGNVWGQPVIGADGTVYFGSVWRETIFYALNPDGSLKWSYPCEGQLRSSPAISADGTIYVGCDDRKLYTFNPNGTLNWTYTTEGEVRSSPVIGSDGTIYVGSNDGKLYAINPDGSLEWEFDSIADVTCTLSLGVDGTIYFVNTGNWLYALNPDGTEQWSAYVGNSGWDNLSSPVVSTDGTIFLVGGDYSNSFLAYNPNGTEKWSYTTSENVFGVPAIGTEGTVYVPGVKLYSITPDGSLNWTHSGGSPISSPAVIAADGTIYLEGANNELLSINPDGMMNWSIQGNGLIKRSPALGPDGTLYYCSQSGPDQVFNAVYPDGSEKWSLVLGDNSSFGHQPIIGADGTAYVSTNFTEFAINPDGTFRWSKPDWFLRAISVDGTLIVYFDGSLRAFNPDLSEKWSYSGEGEPNSSAIIGPEGTIYAGGTDNQLYAINNDGSLKWSSDPLADHLSRIAVGIDGTVYCFTSIVDTNTANIYAFNPDGTNKGGSWPFQVENNNFSYPAVDAEGTVYVGCQDYKVYAINSDGTEKWSYKTGWLAAAPISIGDDGTVYVASQDGKLYAFGE